MVVPSKGNSSKRFSFGWADCVRTKLAKGWKESCCVDRPVGPPDGASRAWAGRKGVRLGTDHDWKASRCVVEMGCIHAFGS